MGKSWMRGLGAGLMEVGNQVELGRRERMEQLREANLMKIAADRDQIARDQMTQSGAQFDKTMTFNTEQAGFEAEHREQMLAGQLADTAANREFQLQSLKFQNEERKRAAQERGDTRELQKATLYGQNFDRFEKITAQAVKDLYGETGMTKEQYELLVAGFEATGDADKAYAEASKLDPRMGLGVRAPEQEKIDQLMAGMQDAWGVIMGPDAGPLDAKKFLGVFPSTFVGSAEEQAEAVKLANTAADVLADAAAEKEAAKQEGPSALKRLDTWLATPRPDYPPSPNAERNMPGYTTFGIGGAQGGNVGNPDPGQHPLMTTRPDPGPVEVQGRMRGHLGPLAAAQQGPPAAPTVPTAAALMGLSPQPAGARRWTPDLYTEK